MIYADWEKRSRELNPACGCEERGTGRLLRCRYHEGAQDGYEAAMGATWTDAAGNPVDAITAYNEGIMKGYEIAKKSIAPAQ